MKTNFTSTSKAAIAALIFSFAVTSSFAKSVINSDNGSGITTGQTSSVKYSSFDGTINSKKAVVLSWVTSVELNNNHFEVECSFDNVNFKTIGLVLDALTVDGDNRSYNFKDNSASLKGKEVAYYRLKQIGKDGKTSHSAAIVVSLQAQQNTDSEVSPNPATKSINVSFNTTEKGNAEIRIINAYGQTLVSKQSNIIKGHNIVLVDGLATLSSGVYVAQIVVNGVIVANQKVIKN